MFHSFLKENVEYAKIMEKFVRNEKTFAVVRQKFIDTIDSYFQVHCNFIIFLLFNKLIENNNIEQNFI